MGRNEARPPGGGGTGGRGTEAAADEEAAEDGAGGAPPDPLPMPLPLPLPLPLPGPGPELDPPLPPPVVGPVGGMAAAHSKHLLADREWAGTARCAVCASSWASLTLARSLFISQDFRSEAGPTTHPPEDTMQCNAPPDSCFLCWLPWPLGGARYRTERNRHTRNLQTY